MYKQKEIRSPNRDRVLECIFRNPGISRKDTSDLTGITSATITAVVGELLREGILTELGAMEEDKGTIGRSRIALNISPDYCYAVGAEFNYSSVTGVVCDLRGKVLYKKLLPHDPEREDITQVLMDLISDCLESAPVPREKIAVIGVGLPGHINKTQTGFIGSSRYWADFDPQALRERFPLPVVFENNVRCMAVAQGLNHPLEAPSNFALLHVGRGMHCAHIIDDELFVGTTYGCGEIAHTIAVLDGKRCECGKRGCLQTVITESALLDNGRMLWQSDPNSNLRVLVPSPEELTLSHMLTAYELGDPAVCRVLTLALRHLAVAALNVAVLMNPEKIFLHGELFESEALRQDFLEEIRRQFEFTGNDYELGTVAYCESTPLDGAIGAAAYGVLNCLIHSDKK